MANIRVDLEHEIIDGQPITFAAPCNCSAVTGLKVYHSGGSKVFTFKDAHGNALTGLGNLFSKGSYVKAILDTTNGFAYLQNADTNAYLEAQLASKAPEDHTHTAADVGARPNTWIPTAKELGFTGAVSTILSNDFATSRALVSNSSGKAASSPITATELGYLDGVTSNIQTQLNDRLKLTVGTSIASNSDLNTFKDPGKYYCASGDVAKTITNTPYTGAGFGLIVTDGYIDGRVYQIALMSFNAIKFRYFTGSTWQPWNAIMTQILDDQSYWYGASLPAAGTKGRIYFKKVT